MSIASYGLGYLYSSEPYETWGCRLFRCGAPELVEVGWVNRVVGVLSEQSDVPPYPKVGLPWSLDTATHFVSSTGESPGVPVVRDNVIGVGTKVDFSMAPGTGMGVEIGVGLIAVPPVTPSAIFLKLVSKRDLYLPVIAPAGCTPMSRESRGLGVVDA